MCTLGSLTLPCAIFVSVEYGTPLPAATVRCGMVLARKLAITKSKSGGNVVMAVNAIPIGGCAQYPHIDLRICEYPSVELSQIISRNLTALMGSYPGRETLAKVAKAAHVGFGTVQRARNGDGNLTVQNLDMIARAFRRTARDLLAEPVEEYGPAAQVAVLAVQEAPVDERELVQGYRDASQEVRDILLDLARKATSKKDCGARSERND